MKLLLVGLLTVASHPVLAQDGVPTVGNTLLQTGQPSNAQAGQAEIRPAPKMHQPAFYPEPGVTIGAWLVDRAPSETKARRMLLDYTSSMAHQLKYNKGNLAGWGFDTPTVVTTATNKILSLEGWDETLRQLHLLRFPAPANEHFIVTFIARAKYRLDKPLPVHVELHHDKLLLPAGSLLGEALVDPATLPREWKDEDVGSAGAKRAADGARKTAKAIGVAEPYASGHVGVGMVELKALGAFLKRATQPVRVSLYSRSPVWRYSRLGANVKFSTVWPSR